MILGLQNTVFPQLATLAYAVLANTNSSVDTLLGYTEAFTKIYFHSTNEQ